MERLENDELKIDVTIPAAEVGTYIDKAYKDLSHRYRVPGFRPGKAPRPVLDSTFGKESIMAEATNAILNEKQNAILTEADVDPLADPAVDDVDLVEKGKDFTYSMRVKVCPEIELTDYEAVAISIPSEEVTDEEIEKELETFQEYYVKYNEIDEERPVEDGDYINITIKGAEGSEMLDTTNRLHQVGSDLMPSSFDDQLVGMEVGEEKTFTFGFDDAEDEDEVEDEKDEAEETEEDSDADDAEETEATDEFTVTVIVESIRKRIVPELDDHFAKEKFGMDDMDAMRESIREEIAGQKKAAIPNIKEQVATRKLAERYDGDVPAEFIEVVRKDLLTDFMRQLEAQGMTVDSYLARQSLSVEQLLSDIELQARDSAVERLALDALARERGIEVTEEDLAAEFEQSGAEDPAELQAQFTEQGRIPSLRAFLRRAKAVDWLLETAEITTLAPGEPLVLDGEDAEDEDEASDEE